jgi:hypothetical protein
MKKTFVGVGICVLLCLASVLPATATDQKIVSPVQSTVKWRQLPDITENGTDVAATFEPAIPRELADDFLCTTTGPITNVHLWGSWMNDQVMSITDIHLSIHADIPANQSPTGYSIPGNVLWQHNFTQDLFKQTLYHEGTAEWWYDPYNGLLLPQADHEIWEYNITIPTAIAFVQNGTAANPTVYWLDAYVDTQGGNFGWKTTPDHWNDDAVYLTTGTNPWQELVYPAGHPYANQSIDLAFEIDTTPPTITVVIPTVSIGKISVKVVSGSSVMAVPWHMGVNERFLLRPRNLTFQGVIQQLDANTSAVIQTGFILGFGPFDFMVQVGGMAPVETTGFILFFIILVHPPNPNRLGDTGS